MNSWDVDRTSCSENCTGRNPFPNILYARHDGIKRAGPRKYSDSKESYLKPERLQR
jgi:hypothetical protein